MRRGLLAVALCSALVAAACSSTQTAQRAAPPTLGWVNSSAQAFNGAPPAFDAITACGSTTDTYLAELLHKPPTDLKVLYEWGDTVPGGKQLLVSGNVATVHLGPGDLPVDHPLGDDLSMDVNLDQPYQIFSRQVGTAHSDVKPNQLHVEISSGFIPHVPRPSSAVAGQTWRQLADFNLSSFQPGFDRPAIGDQILVGGRYIVDCGHPDLHSELHPISFLAWSHRDGARTVVHLYSNPYRDSQLFSSDLAALGQVNNTSRLAAAKPLPPYLVDEVVGLLGSKVNRLQAPELVEAIQPPSPTTWQVCTPSDSSRGRLRVNYDLRTNPGVTVQVTPDPSRGCATVNTAINAYRAADLSVRSCVMPWDYLSRIAGAALGTTVDVKGLIRKNVPQQFWPLVDQDPLTGCGDALSGAPVSGQPAAQAVQVDPSQPFPLYGVITLEHS